jgi:hypothetical protein
MVSDNEQLEFERTLESLTSPAPLQAPEDLEEEVKLRPRYVGPGLWYSLAEAAVAERSGEQESASNKAMGNGGAGHRKRSRR